MGASLCVEGVVRLCARGVGLRASVALGVTMHLRDREPLQRMRVCVCVPVYQRVCVVGNRNNRA